MNINEKISEVRSMKKHFRISYFTIIKEYLSKKKESLKLNDKSSNISFNITFNQLPSLALLLDNNWKIIKNTETYLQMSGPKGEMLSCRTQIGNDFGHIVEIYINNAYGIDFEGKNVIDIGMSNGDSSIFFAKNGAKLVVGVEPDKRSFNLALNNINESQVNRIVLPLNKALSDKDGIVQLLVYNSNPNGNSIDETNMVKLNDSNFKESIEAINLSTVVNMFKGEDIHFLKMDCEGCEYNVLRNISKELFSKILKINLEYHHGLQDIPEILNKNGFHIKVIRHDNLIGYIKASR